MGGVAARNELLALDEAPEQARDLSAATAQEIRDLGAAAIPKA